MRIASSDVDSSTHFNLSVAEREALRRLAKRSDIVVKKAEKGASIVVHSIGNYLARGNRHVDDEKTYIPLRIDDHTQAIGESINRTIDDFERSQAIDPMTAAYLRHEAPETIRTQ